MSDPDSAAPASTLWKRLSPPAIHVLGALIFWGQIQNYMMRVSIKLIIVAMAKDTITRKDDDASDAPEKIPSQCLANATSEAGSAGASSSSSRLTEGEFEWDALDRGLILSALGYGYIITQILGGRLSEKIGFKRVYGGGLLAAAVLTLLGRMDGELITRG